jgi:hypothetical protein
VRRFLLKSGEERTQVLIIQAEANKANEIMRQFDKVNETNPYEYISWNNWIGFHQSNKEATIKANNNYLENHSLINLQGFKDDSMVLMGSIKEKKMRRTIAE